MNHTPNFDAKIKTILDAIKPGLRVCSVTKEKWVMTEEEIGWYKKFNVPPSDVSPIERRKNLLGFNTGMNIWWNRHAFTGKPLLSYVHPDNQIKVLPDAEWHAHDWGKEVNANVDPKTPMFDQMRALLLRIPMPAARLWGEPKNSIGVSISSCEDSFMVFAGVKNTKRTSYAYTPQDIEDSQDLLWATSCINCFWLIYCQRMHSCRVALHSDACMKSDFIFDCHNCEHCFLSSNLRNKKYVFKNKQYTQEGYENEVSKIDLTSYSQFQNTREEYFDMVGRQAVWPSNFNIQCQNSTGEYLFKCLNCSNSHSMTDATDIYETQLGHSRLERLAYVSGITSSADVYMSAGNTVSSHVLFSTTSNQCSNIEYCYNCVECENCFACVGAHRMQYAILNKTYDEQTYWKLVDEIKCAMLERGEYGRFFPGDFSLAGIIQATELFLPLSEQEKTAFGAVHLDPARGAVLSGDHAAAAVSPLPSSELPDKLEDGAKYVGKPLLDEMLDRPFCVRKEDYAFYERMHLPLPREHFTARLKSMGKLANTFMHTNGTCASCGVEIKFAVNQKFTQRKIFCRLCYLKYLEER